MPGRPALRSLTLVCAALASSVAGPRARAQSEVADLREDVRGLSQRIGELTLRVEQLEHENAQLRAKVAALDRAGDFVTSAQFNAAVADLNASIKTSVGSSRTEILQEVATQMEKLARQTNAALDSIARTGTTAQARPAGQAQGPAPAFGSAYPKEGVSYTVQKGDSIGLIAKKTGARAQDIIDANKLADPSRIQAGQVLFVPGGK
ncbi:MAG TPA: LysM peptidoglycan-binding domain-containing protein [Opitutaceae bacterium]|nr:LysM peptidoglycan-binding domain-containing protein [Opitutaceae bacterium]